MSKHSNVGALLSVRTFILNENRVTLESDDAGRAAACQNHAEGRGARQLLSDASRSEPLIIVLPIRFTDGQPLRIGGGLPPITDPSAIPEQPIFADEDELLVPPSEVPSEAALQAPIPDELPLPPVPPAAIEPAPSVPDPAPPAPEPHAIELLSDAPLVSADALTPPPLVLDEKPAERTPSGSIKRPAGTPPPKAAASAPQPPQITPASKATARPSGTMPKPGASPAPKPASAQPTAKSKAPKQQQQPAASAKPSPAAATSRPAAPPPTVLTPKDVKASEKKPVAAVPPKPVAFDDDDTFDETLPSPTVYRVLAALIPIVLILGMAATAIVLSRRSAFDREPDAQQASAPAPSTTSDSTKAMPAVPVPTVTPAPPPLVVTPDSEVTAETQATPDTQATPPTAVAPAPPPAPAAAKPRFTLSVGTYLFSDRARMRTEQLSRLTHMKSWVVTTTADGSFTYRVMVGEFVKQSEAERMADKLLSNGLVSEALVEKLPPQQ